MVLGYMYDGTIGFIPSTGAFGEDIDQASSDTDRWIENNEEE